MKLKKPKPTPLSQTLPYSRVNEHRAHEEGESHIEVSWTCPHYELCLMKAARSDWRSFTCQRCPLRPVPPEGGPGGVVLGDDEEPDLRPIAALEEPLPVVDNLADLAMLIRKSVRSPMRSPNTVLDEDRLCLDCFETMKAGDEAWYCPNCCQLICERCTPHHDACAENLLE